MKHDEVCIILLQLYIYIYITWPRSQGVVLDTKSGYSNAREDKKVVDRRRGGVREGGWM